jgi:hypothetical protein
MARMWRNCFLLSISLTLCLYLLYAFIFSKIMGHTH